MVFFHGSDVLGCDLTPPFVFPSLFPSILTPITFLTRDLDLIRAVLTPAVPPPAQRYHRQTTQRCHRQASGTTAKANFDRFLPFLLSFPFRVWVFSSRCPFSADKFRYAPNIIDATTPSTQAYHILRKCDDSSKV